MNKEPRIKLRLRKTIFGSKCVSIVHSILAGDVHLREGQLLLQEKTLNTEKSLIYQERTERRKVSRTQGQNVE
jgi:hypothetical protein